MEGPVTSTQPLLQDLAEARSLCSPLHRLFSGQLQLHALNAFWRLRQKVEMTESAFGVLELSGEAKTREGGGGVGGGGRRLRQGICRTWGACFSIIAKIRIVGTAFGSNRSCIA